MMGGITGSARPGHRRSLHRPTVEAEDIHPLGQDRGPQPKNLVHAAGEDIILGWSQRAGVERLHEFQRGVSVGLGTPKPRSRVFRSLVSSSSAEKESIDRISTLFSHGSLRVRHGRGCLIAGR